MQRFKKEFELSSGVSHATVLRMVGASDKSNKFVYGANGTLTQAARWRAEAFRMLTGAWTLGNPSGFGYVRCLLDSSRQGGCRLPA